MTEVTRNRIIPCAGVLAAALLSTSAPALAAGDAERGKSLSVPCQACHGVDGNSENPAFPTLAGQHADYLVRALEAYQTGERNNAIMQGFAATLSKQDRADLAAWYGSQKGLKTLEGQR